MSSGTKSPLIEFLNQHGVVMFSQSLRNFKSELSINNIRKKHNLACLVLIGISVCLSFDSYAENSSLLSSNESPKIVSISDYQIGAEGLLPSKKDTGITRHLTSLYSGEFGNSVTSHDYLSDVVWVETNKTTSQERVLYYGFNVGQWKHKLNSETSILMQAFITQPLLVFLPDEDKTDIANYLVETPLFKEAVKSHKNLLLRNLTNTPLFNDSLSALGETAIKHLNATQKQNSTQVFKAEYNKEFGTIQRTTSYAAKIIANTNLTFDTKSSSFDIFDGMNVKGTADKQLEFTSNSTLYYGVQKVTDFENQKGGFTDLISRHFFNVPVIDPVVGWSSSVFTGNQKKTSLDISSSTLTPLDKVNQSVDVAVFMNNPNSSFDAPMAMNLVNVGGLVLKVAGINFSMKKKEITDKYEDDIKKFKDRLEYVSMMWSIAKSAQELACIGTESKEGMCGDYFKKFETIGNLIPTSYKGFENTLDNVKNAELQSKDFNTTTFCGNATMKALSFGSNAFSSNVVNTTLDSKRWAATQVFLCTFDALITKPLLLDKLKIRDATLYNKLNDKGYIDKSILLTADFLKLGTTKIEPKYKLTSLMLAIRYADINSPKEILKSINFALDAMTSELKFFNSVLSGKFDGAVFTDKLKNVVVDFALEKAEKAAGEIIYNAIKAVTPAKYVELAVILGNEGTALAYDWATDPSVIKLKMKQLPNNQLQIVHSVPDMEAARYLSLSSLDSVVNYSSSLKAIFLDDGKKILTTSPIPDSNHLLVNSGFTASVENQTIFAKVDRGNIDKLLKNKKVSVMWHVKRFDNSSDERTLLKSERTAANSFGYVKGKPSNNYKSTNNITGIFKNPVINVNSNNPAYKNIAAAKLTNAQAIDFTKVYKNFMGSGDLVHKTSGIYSDFTDISITATDGSQKSYQNTFNVYVLPELNNVESVNLDEALNYTSRIYCKSYNPYSNCSEVQVNFFGNQWDKIAGRNGLHAVWMSSEGNVKSESINLTLPSNSGEQTVLRIPSDIDVSSDYLVIYEDVMHGYLQKSGKSMIAVLEDAFKQRLKGAHYPVLGLKIGKLQPAEKEILVKPLDTDNDGVLDEFDAFPLDNQWQDDTDEDGMPDKWETQYGLDMNVNDAKLDKNKNGISNLDEFKAKFDPSTIPTIEATASAGDGKVVIAWNKLAGFDKQKVCYITTWAITDVFDCVNDSDSTTLENQTSPATVNNLTNGKTYYFVVGAVNSTKSYATSNVIAVTPKAETVKQENFSTLNDTGITTCSDNSINGLACPINDFPNQDAQVGRDKTKNDDSDGHAGFSFTKISSSGKELPASAPEWNCVKDNVTGLMWEIKTTDGGLHDMNNRYTWYEPDNSKNGGKAGTQNGGSCKGSDCDTNAYVKAVNAVGYCGYKDWRMPTRQELVSIVDSSHASLTLTHPTIDTNYFPNTNESKFWSSSPYASSSNYAQMVIFNGGGSSGTDKDGSYNVRLVR
ncbi:MAG: DUF1566 domain-containing protein [Methylococcaceae bacterium]